MSGCCVYVVWHVLGMCLVAVSICLVVVYMGYMSYDMWQHAASYDMWQHAATRHRYSDQTYMLHDMCCVYALRDTHSKCNIHSQYDTYYTAHTKPIWYILYTPPAVAIYTQYLRTYCVYVRRYCVYTQYLRTYTQLVSIKKEVASKNKK